MLIALWIITALVTIAFLGAGLSKILRPKAALVASGMEWAGDFSDPKVKTIGVIEVIGALGVILPFVTGIAPLLSPIAATGLTLVMIGAVVIHIQRNENPAPAAVLGLVAAAAAVLGFINL